MVQIKNQNYSKDIVENAKVVMHLQILIKYFQVLYFANISLMATKTRSIVRTSQNILLCHINKKLEIQEKNHF